MRCNTDPHGIITHITYFTWIYTIEVHKEEFKYYQHIKRGQSLNDLELNQKPELIKMPYCKNNNSPSSPGHTKTQLFNMVYTTEHHLSRHKS